MPRREAAAVPQPSYMAKRPGTPMPEGARSATSAPSVTVSPKDPLDKQEQKRQVADEKAANTAQWATRQKKLAALTTQQQKQALHILIAEACRFHLARMPANQWKGIKAFFATLRKNVDENTGVSHESLDMIAAQLHSRGLFRPYSLLTVEAPQPNDDIATIPPPTPRNRWS